MWSRIQPEAVVIVPDDGLHGKRQGAKMALMSDGGHKLQTKAY